MKWLRRKAGNNSAEEKKFNELTDKEIWALINGTPAKSGFGRLIAELGLCAVLAVSAVAAYKAITAPEKGLKLVNPHDEITVPIAGSNASYSDISFIIDAGHGGVSGENVGTTILGYNIPERDYVLDVANELAIRLRSMGYSGTSMTRDTIDPNLTLQQRLAKFKKEAQNIGVSIHVNGCSDSSVRGAIVYHNHSGEELAGYVARSLKPIFGSASARSSDGFRVLKGAKPAVLVELGFGGSNAEDARILVDRQAEIITALADALGSYYQGRAKN